MTDLNLYDEVKEQFDVPAADVLQGVRVIFADEDPTVLSTYKHITQRLHWTGLYAIDADHLLEEINNITAQGIMLDAVVLDVKYSSGPTGITAARQVRQVMPDVPIVFISNYVTSIIREEARRVSAEMIRKPFDPAEVFRRLAQLIYWYRMSTPDLVANGERRVQSINTTTHFRRASDRLLATPSRISEVTQETSRRANNARG